MDNFVLLYLLSQLGLPSMNWDNTKHMSNLVQCCRIFFSSLMCPLTLIEQVTFVP